MTEAKGMLLKWLDSMINNYENERKHYYKKFAELANESKNHIDENGKVLKEYRDELSDCLYLVIKSGQMVIDFEAMKASIEEIIE